MDLNSIFKMNNAAPSFSVFYMDRHYTAVTQYNVTVCAIAIKSKEETLLQVSYFESCKLENEMQSMLIGYC